MGSVRVSSDETRVACLFQVVIESVSLTSSFFGSTIVYLQVAETGYRLMESQSPKVNIRFPKKDDANVATKDAKIRAARKTVSDEGEWLSARPKGTKRKATTTKATKKTKKAPAKKSGQAKLKVAVKKPKAPKAKSAASDVIELSSDDESDDHAPIARLKKTRMSDSSEEDNLWHDDSESENEFI